VEYLFRFLYTDQNMHVKKLFRTSPDFLKIFVALFPVQPQWEWGIAHFDPVVLSVQDKKARLWRSQL